MSIEAGTRLNVARSVNRPFHRQVMLKSCFEAGRRIVSHDEIMAGHSTIMGDFAFSPTFIIPDFSIRGLLRMPALTPGTVVNMLN